MTSAINTNGINVNYPVPGVNNSSQGFRDNFSAIKSNFNTTATEITDLQNKAVVKQALDGTTVDNNMANTVISNAATRSFRATTYNLGNALSGTVVVNASLGDVQYGTISGNTIIEFGGWAPAGTQSNLQLVLTFANANAVVQFPPEVTNTPSFGVTTLENYANSIVGNVATITAPHGSNIADYRLSTLDCGASITIEQYNRPRQATQIQQRTPPATGQLGDKTGAISIDAELTAAPTTCTAASTTYDIITCGSTAGFYLDMPVSFSGNVFGGVIAGQTYYVRSIPTSTTFTISSTPGTSSGPAAVFNLTTASGNMTVTPLTYLYVATRDFDANVIAKASSNTIAESNSQFATSTSSTGNVITVTNTSSYVVGYPVTFSSTYANTYATTTGAGGAVVAGNVAVMGSSTISGTTLTVGALVSGTIEPNMVLTGTGVSANTYIVSGAGSTWTISPSQTVASTTITGVRGIVGTTLTTSVISSGTVATGLWVNGTGVLPGTYITGGSGNTWTVNQSQTVGLLSANLTTSKITVADTSLFTVGQPVVMAGITLGGLSGNYYVKAIPDSGSPGNITIASTYGGANVQVDYGTGNMTVIYGGLFGNLTSNTYYIQSVPSSTTFTVSETIGGAPVALTNANGPTSGSQAMTVTTTTGYTISLNNTNDLVVNSPVIFTGSTFGGVTANTPYYINNIDGGNAKISISQTRYNGIAGQTMPVITANSASPMTMYAYNGTSIWKRLQLDSF